MKKVVLYNEKTKEVIACGFDDMWVLPIGVEIRAYNGNDEPVFLNGNDGKAYLKDNAFITRIDYRR